MQKKAIYKKQILKELYFSGLLSCAALSARIGKSLPLTNTLLLELIADNYVQESGLAPSSGGRRAVNYAIKPDTIYMLSVAMDQMGTSVSLMDIGNNHVNDVVRFELPMQNNPRALPELAQKLVAIIDNCGVHRKKIMGVGIGMPGFIDAEKGLNHTFLKGGAQSVSGYLTEKTGLPVYIANDSSIIALAEFRFGAARNTTNAMVINLGWGVGLGMVLNGQLFRGNNGFAGEFSHIPMFDNNKLCSCGKSGCLETETSLMVVIEKLGHGLRAGHLSMIQQPFPSGDVQDDWQAIVTAALKGDKFAVKSISEVGYHIGRGAAILIHLMNPELIILSGRGALAGNVWQAPVQQALNEHCIPRLFENTSVTISSLGPDAELIGAAAWVMENQVMQNTRLSERCREMASIE